MWSFGSVTIAVLAGVQNAGEGRKGGLGDLGEDGGHPGTPEDRLNASYT
jgi:hypothetical protein